MIRHVHFEDLGSFQKLLSDRACEIKYFEAGTDSLLPIGDKPPDLLVVLGGPISANDDEAYPWLADILRILAERVSTNKPTLGICLGAQLLARSLGADVCVGHVREIGWSPLTLTEAGLRSPMRHLSKQNTSMLHWHADTFDLPPGSTLLASSAHYRNQAFSHGPKILALQCHPEVQQRFFERWLIGHAGEISSTPSLCVQRLRAEAIRYGGGLEAAATAMFNEWLDTLA